MIFIRQFFILTQSMHEHNKKLSRHSLQIYVFIYIINLLVYFLQK